MAESCDNDEEVHFLRTDDAIYLQCVRQKDQGKVCLAAEGFGNRLCYVEPSQDTVDAEPTDAPRCVFVLSQALSVRALQELLASEEVGIDMDDDREIRPDLMSTESQAEGGATHSRTLLYGNAIQLKHELSGMFLTCLTTASSANDQLAFDVGLGEEETGETSWWTVHPTSKQRSEGEKVRIGDDLILISISSERYLHLSCGDGDDSSVQASFQQSMWTVGPVASGGSKAQGYLTGGDAIRLFHGHMDDCLTMHTMDENKSHSRSIIYESGSAGSHARSLWRLELMQIKWFGSHVSWGCPFRLRHITSGLYLCMLDDRSLMLMGPENASYRMSAFCWQSSKDKAEPLTEHEIDGMGVPVIKYGDSVCYLQHVETGLWVSYQVVDTKSVRVGPKQRKAVLHHEGHMDDGLALSRAQSGESRTATIIRRTAQIFLSFISALDSHQPKKLGRRPDHPNVAEMEQCVNDLIDYFIEQEDKADDGSTDEHEVRQIRKQELKNRQDLFQEEGAISRILQCIDKLGAYGDTGNFAQIVGSEAAASYEFLLNSMYVLLAATVRGNRDNCAKFARHLDWLISQFDGQQASMGILEVLSAVLSDSQEALNMIKPDHIKSIISLLEKHGRNAKVLEVLCSLCVCNGVAVRSNQNLICETLLPGRDLLLQTTVLGYITNVQPNIFMGVSASCAQYKKWYYELLVEKIDPVCSSSGPHLRVGWGNTVGFSPYPVGGDYFGEAGVGDDIYSYGYDGLNLWTSHRACSVGSNNRHLLAANDIVSCCMDLSIPSISFRINGQPVQGMFEDFNLNGLFFPVVSFSAGIKVRFLFGGPHGEFKFLPPVGYAPTYEALLPGRRLFLSPCKSYGNLSRGYIMGPGSSWEHTVFVPNAVNTQNVILSHFLQAVVPKLAESIHELWAMTRIQGGWSYGTVRDEAKKQNPCLVEFARLPAQERSFNLTMSYETLRTIIALGYHVGIADEEAEYNLRKLKLPRSYIMASGYKPSPIDLSHIKLTQQMEDLVEKLANNAHNVWARERVKQGWTYGVNLDVGKKRNPRLVPFSLLDELAKQSNRNSIRELIRTLIGHGYMIEPPDDRLKDKDTKKKNQVQCNKMRIFRAERTHAVQSDKWYFEFTVESKGEIRVGWATPDCLASTDLGADAKAFVFDGHNALKWNNGAESFGRRWNAGDVVGCLLDFNEGVISFTLNGELLIDGHGQETAFENLSSDISLVPVVSLAVDQRGFLNFGRDSGTFKFYSSIGQQEGFQPFAFGMRSPIAMWFTKNLPSFCNIDETDQNIEVKRLPANNHRPPRLKVIHKQIGGTGSHDFTPDWFYTRLNLPITMATVFTKSPGHIINLFNESESVMEEDIDNDFEVLRKTARGGLSPPLPAVDLKNERHHHHHHGNSNTLPIPGLKVSKFHFSKPKSSMVQGNNGVNNTAKSRLTEEVLPDQYADVLYKNDIDQLLQSTQYSFSVRIFPEQDPGSVFVGWVTSDFHWNAEKFQQEFIPTVTITLGDDKGKVSESVKRSNCFVLWGGDLHQQTSATPPPANQSSPGILVTCIIDISTGLLTFTANGKNLNTFYQVEPNVRLYPAVFSFPTTHSVFQFELGRSKNCMPLSAAVLECERKNVIPQCPPRLVVQSLRKVTWTRMPSKLPHPECRRESVRSKGWTSELKPSNTDAYNAAILHVPEENRCIDLLELTENEELLHFHEQTLKLYRSMCALGNHRVSHALCSYVDQKQLMHVVRNNDLIGSIRATYHNLLIEMHLAPHANARKNTQHEYMFPLNEMTRSIGLFANPETKDPTLPGVGSTSSLRPSMHWSQVNFVMHPSLIHERPLHVPEFPLDELCYNVILQLQDAVVCCYKNCKDIMGKNQQYVLVPLIRLTTTLLEMGVFVDEDVKKILILLDPNFFGSFMKDMDGVEALIKNAHSGLLCLDLVESVKLVLCDLLEHLMNLVLRHRVEALVSFSCLVVDHLQQNQRNRYQRVMESVNMSAAMTAKMTREFRSPPMDQMAILLKFKNEELEEECPLPPSIKDLIWNFHMDMLIHCGETIEDVETNETEIPLRSRLVAFISHILNRKNDKADETGEEQIEVITSLRDLITSTMVRWAQGSRLNNPQLVRSIFQLLYRQFNGVAIQCINKTYCISEISEVDTMGLLDSLSRLRSLLSVKLGEEEETLIIKELNTIMNNKVFYQHPNLMRVLCMHETVMEVMVSVLGGEDDETNSNEVQFPRMVAACCRFLCYFCRISRLNQGALFEHLGFLLEHSAVGLASPSMRGSTPLDVAAASVMDNNELALALKESDLAKIVEQLGTCGVESCQLLLRKGYPDIGWNPVEGERYLDFLKNAVFVNGESVEENANLVVRQLIRRTECLGPSLRGEGGHGLLSAITSALQICRDRSKDGPDNNVLRNDFDDENDIHMGFSILAFYSTLIDLLGRCAPEQCLIMQGKSDAIRIRSILRSLVPLEDLIGVISLPFELPRLERDGSTNVREPDLSACFIPDHKASMVLFLERVYGVDDPKLMLRLLEVGMLPDMKAAAQLDTPLLHTTDMALSLNRYMCYSLLPMLVKHVELLEQWQHRVVLIDQLLHTIYRMSQAQALTKAQKEMISNCLVAVAGVLRPSLLQGLLRKLTFDVPALTEETYVPIRLLTQHYARCWKYYYLHDGCSEFGRATDEEKHITMVLFWGIFDSLAKKPYQQELFSKVLPCLCSIANALPADYALSPALEQLKEPSITAHGKFVPRPVDTKCIMLPEKLDTFVNKYSEQWHDTWALERFTAGWTYDSHYNDHFKHHPMLKPYRLLNDREKDVYRPTVREGIKTLLAWGWTIRKARDATEQLPAKVRCSSQSNISASEAHGYLPRPYDLSGVILSREMMRTAEMLAENFHLVWAKKKFNEMEAKMAANSSQPSSPTMTTNPMLVPYDRLTAKEKEKDRSKSYDLLKFFQFNSYMLTKDEKEELDIKSSVEKRFSSMMLVRLLNYVEKSTVYVNGMIQAAETVKQRRQEHAAFGNSQHDAALQLELTGDHDIKFFAKVGMPFIESYFKTQEIYYVTVSGSLNEGMSVASNKEKEAVTLLFCKMALLIRQRTAMFGVDASVAINCIKVLAECIDASTITKSCPEHIKQALITFFNNAAEDLKKMLNHIRSGRMKHLRKMMLGAQTTNYVTHCILPVLTILFRHLGRHNFGKDLLLDEIQVSCYKILNGLYSLGTGKGAFIDRHRSQVGECLAAFASAFPVPFLEPRLNKFNSCSIYNILSIKDRKLLGLPPKLEQLTPLLPTLNNLLSDISHLAESGAKYEEAPEMIDIILPMICRYLPMWWKQGACVAQQTNDKRIPIEESSGCGTAVSGEILNNILRDVLRLIQNNLGSDEADWMKRIAVYAQPILVQSDPDLLTSHFLPILNKSLKRIQQIRDLEEQLAGHKGSMNDLLNIVKYEQRVNDVSDLELLMLEDYGIIARDLYAFYPLLVRYIDLSKSLWIREKNQNAIALFKLLSEILVIWAKSVNFRREEQNFVVQHEIDNMSVLTADKSATPNAASALANRRIVKKRGDRYSPSTSLIVACVKRMLPVALNMGKVGDCNLLQEAKTRFLKKEMEDDVKEYLISALRENVNEDLTNEHGDITTRADWLLEISRVQYHLHLTEHPPKSRRAVWKKLMSKQRKRAVVSCFRMVPLYNLPIHKVISMFVPSYSQHWVYTDQSNFAGKLINLVHKPNQEEGKTLHCDPLSQLIQVFSMSAVTSVVENDDLYLAYSELMTQSCHTGDDEEEDEGEESEKSFEEKEKEKQRLLYEQKRLATRGVAEMVLYMISASGGDVSDTIVTTLQLGIALLTGGNVLVQKIMLDHLKAKKDVRFFTSVAGLMDQCSVLDLNAYERSLKSESLGHVNECTITGEKTMSDAELTCALFRFLQLLCEGHNADFQNYLRTQVGNNTTVNIIISTVDYLLRLQEAISDFYWYYSAKETIDAPGQENFSKAIAVAKQVFNTLTEYIQGPCEGNQQALAHSRLWDAVVGFLHVFANMQMKLSQDSKRQLSLLKELLDLQQDMIVMLLSMLEGNVVDGTIGRQLVDTLIESSHNVELILRFFNMFLRLKDITSSDKFLEYDAEHTGFVSRKDFQRAMEASKIYSSEEIDFLLACAVSTDDKLNYDEFTEQFHEPAADIGFNMAVLLTNLAEHMPRDTRLKKFLEMAEAMLEYFQPNLGRIEIIGSAKRIERVYFNIKPSSLDQWHKPQVQESKRQFFFDVINDEGDNGRMEEFVNFCEDTIFEMQLASEISEAGFGASSSSAVNDEEGDDKDEEDAAASGEILPSFNFKVVKSYVRQFRAMTWIEVITSLVFLFFTFNIKLCKLSIELLQIFGNFLYVLFFSNFLVVEVKKKSLTEIIDEMPCPTHERIQHSVENLSDSGTDDTGQDQTKGDKEDFISDVFGMDIKKSKELIKAVVHTKPEAGFGDFTVDEAADTFSLIASDYESGINTPRTSKIKKRRKLLRKGKQIGQTASTTSTILSSLENSSTSEQRLSNLKSAMSFDERSGEDNISPWYTCMKECGRPARYKHEEKTEDRNAMYLDTWNAFCMGTMGLFARNFYKFKILALGLTFCINFILLFYKWHSINNDLKVDSESSEDEVEESLILEDTSKYMEPTLRAFSIIHFILSFSMLVSYYGLKVPLVIFKREKEVARKLEFDGLYVNEDPTDDDLSGRWDKLVISCPSFPSNYWDKFIKKKVLDKFGEQCGQDRIQDLLGMDHSNTSFLDEEEPPKGNILTQLFLNVDIKYTVWKTGVIFSDQSFLYLLWYFVMSIFGQYNRFFFSLHLLDIAMCSKGLRTILTSVTHNGKQLVLTIGLLTVVVYLYTVIAFNFFKKFYNKGEGDDEDWKCNNMFTCFQFHFYSGVRAGGGIGDELEDPSGDAWEFYRIAFDISFFFFVVVILLAIIQGLIIDAFGELRDQQEQVKEDMDTKCFICTIGIDYFDQVPHGFETHTLQEHNLANYMFFLMHLINKDETEHTGQETYVWQQYQERCWEFFPVGDCFRKQYENELSG
uniref:ryanodine receptor 3 n=1 Tax=Ciona intestinalis TaxID=7719 RepID=UPI00089DB8C7|nr:ryanodine receptor 3 [Ciona intestinalis]|eukprot:XP_018669433.1 ryanodine receptor 3 [Ciona intestinalis]